MRLDINLAAQPFQDMRRFFVRWALGLFAVTLLTAGLVYSAAIAYRDWRSSQQQISTLRAQIEERERQRSAVEAILNRPENRDTRDQAQFLNALLARKAFSWTRVFSDLEKIVPPRLHVTRIQPAINKENQLELHLAVAGSSRDSAIELVRKLEESPHFAHARVNSETNSPGGPDASQFDVSAVYVPQFAREGK